MAVESSPPPPILWMHVLCAQFWMHSLPVLPEPLMNESTMMQVTFAEFPASSPRNIANNLKLAAKDCSINLKMVATIVGVHFDLHRCMRSN